MHVCKTMWKTTWKNGEEKSCEVAGILLAAYFKDLIKGREEEQ